MKEFIEAASSRNYLKSLHLKKNIKLYRVGHNYSDTGLDLNGNRRSIPDNFRAGYHCNDRIYTALTRDKYENTCSRIRHEKDQFPKKLKNRSTIREGRVPAPFP
jgi:hypothetical protein